MIKGAVLVCAMALASCQQPVALGPTPAQPLQPTDIAISPNSEARPTDQVVGLPAPDVPTDARWQQLIAEGFELVTTSASADVPMGTVRAFLVTDATKDSIMVTGGHVVDFEEAGGPGSCVLAFYLWNNATFRLVNLLGEGEYHYWCDILNWDAPTAGTFFKFRDLDATTRRVLDLRSTWSDMNANGWPELAVAYNDCLNDCDGYEGIVVRLYEMRESGVVDIAADLDGTLVPDDLLVESDPPSFGVMSMVNHGFDQKVWRTTIYSWDGARFVDQSRNHPDYYRGRIARILGDLSRRAGTKVWPYQTGPFLEILDIANVSGIPVEDGLAAFLDATDPKQWPGTDQITLCWLQLARANAQVDAKAGGPFRIYAMDGEFVTGEFSSLAQTAAELGATGFDTSACP